MAANASLGLGRTQGELRVGRTNEGWATARYRSYSFAASRDLAAASVRAFASSIAPVMPSSRPATDKGRPELVDHSCTGPLVGVSVGYPPRVDPARRVALEACRERGLCPNCGATVIPGSGWGSGNPADGMFCSFDCFAESRGPDLQKRAHQNADGGRQ